MNKIYAQRYYLDKFDLSKDNLYVVFFRTETGNYISCDLVYETERITEMVEVPIGKYFQDYEQCKNINRVDEASKCNLLRMLVWDGLDV